MDGESATCLLGLSIGITASGAPPRSTGSTLTSRSSFTGVRWRTLNFLMSPPHAAGGSGVSSSTTLAARVAAVVACSC